MVIRMKFKELFNEGNRFEIGKYYLYPARTAPYDYNIYIYIVGKTKHGKAHGFSIRDVSGWRKVKQIKLGFADPNFYQEIKKTDIPPKLLNKLEDKIGN